MDGLIVLLKELWLHKHLCAAWWHCGHFQFFFPSIKAPRVQKVYGVVEIGLFFINMTWYMMDYQCCVQVFISHLLPLCSDPHKSHQVFTKGETFDL